MNKDTKAKEKPAAPAKRRNIDIPEDGFTPEGILITSPWIIDRRMNRDDRRSRRARTERRN